MRVSVNFYKTSNVDDIAMTKGAQNRLKRSFLDNSLTLLRLEFNKKGAV